MMTASSASHQPPSQTPDAIPGAVKAAIILLALGEERGAIIWQTLSDAEARLVSSIMAKLGSIRRDVLFRVAKQFIQEVTTTNLTGGPEPTQKILLGALPRPQAKSIIEEIKTPESPDLWQKLSMAKADHLVSYLSKEYPQTIAIIISKITTEQAARALALMSPALATDIVDRMLRLEPVADDIMRGIETSIEENFIAPPPLPGRRDPIDRVAEIFNAFDKKSESRFLAALDSKNRSAAQKLRALMFSFDELSRLDATSAQTLIRSIERETLIKALKGATKGTKEFFFSQMSQRAARSMVEDMDALGPVRLKDVDEAQRSVVNLAKDLAAKGELVLATRLSDDEMVE
jgi:flagellar motor switch protein FliG